MDPWRPAGDASSRNVPGGNPPMRPDQALQPKTRAGSGPAPQSQTFIGHLIIVFGSGPGTGFFLYNGSPGPGNPPILSITTATTDPYGNPVPANTINAPTLPLIIGAVIAATETLNPGPLLEYGTSNPTVQVLLTGSGNFTMPAGVTSVLAECWGSGQTGANSTVSSAGIGGFGGEYAAEPTLAVTPGNLYAFSQGTGGANSTFAGDSVTVTAHGGNANGTGSTNTTHFNGAAGGSQAGLGSGGGGGGSSAGTSVAGNIGHGGVVTGGGTGGAGGAAPFGGGAGGAGGNNGINGNAGSAPGGGGGGAGSGTGHTGGAGAAGQIRLTYTPTGGVTALYAALATFANSDASGNSWNAGLGLLKTVYPLVGTPAAPETWHVVGAASQPAFQNSFSAGGTSPRFQLEPVNGSRVRLSGAVNTGASNVAEAVIFNLPAGYRPARAFSFVTPTNITAYVLGEASVDITTGGDVRCNPVSTTGKFLLLDGICFELD